MDQRNCIYRSCHNCNCGHFLVWFVPFSRLPPICREGGRGLRPVVFDIPIPTLPLKIHQVDASLVLVVVHLCVPADDSFHFIGGHFMARHMRLHCLGLPIRFIISPSQQDGSVSFLFHVSFCIFFLPMIILPLALPISRSTWVVRFHDVLRNRQDFKLTFDIVFLFWHWHKAYST